MRRPGFLPEVGRPAWLVLGGDCLSAIGSGLTLPFFVVYLHQVRGLDLQAAALALAIVALAGLAGNPAGGSLVDRIGARNTLMIGLLLAACGAASLALVHQTWQAFAAAAILGFGSAVVWPAQDSLLAIVVAPEQRSAVFSLRHATLNVGLGLGAVLAALIVDSGSSSTFVWLYLIDAATYLAFMPILFLVKAGTRPPAPEDDVADQPDDGYRVVITDRLFLRIWGLTALLVAAGFSQMHASFPVFATETGGISANALGVVFAANTFTVVAAQLVVLRWMHRWRRTTGIALTCCAWGCAWGITLIAGQTAGALAVAGFASALAVFAIGEALLTPSLTPMVNDIVPERLRGRYNGVYTLAWTSGFILGPLIAGSALEAQRSTAFFLGLIAVCAIAAVAAVTLAGRVPTAANTTARAWATVDTTRSVPDLDD